MNGEIEFIGIVYQFVFPFTHFFIRMFVESEGGPIGYIAKDGSFMPLKVVFPLLSTCILTFPSPSAIIILLLKVADKPDTKAPIIVLALPVVIPLPVL